MEINWTLITYIIIALFALSGFFKGWWKEAITTFFLGILIFFLQMPNIADGVVNGINKVLELLVSFVPSSIYTLILDIFESALGIRTGTGAIQVDSGSQGTWFIVMAFFIGVAVFFSRLSLPNGRQGSNQAYVVRPMGSVLGGLVGGLNGFLIINLIREYLDGRNLPFVNRPGTEIAMNGGSNIGIASSGVSIQATDLPQFTILDGLSGWVVLGIVLLLFLLVVGSRGVRGRKSPLGYTKWTSEAK